MIWFLVIFEQFLVLQLYHPFLSHAYEVKKVNFIYLLIRESATLKNIDFYVWNTKNLEKGIVSNF